MTRNDSKYRFFLLILILLTLLFLTAAMFTMRTLPAAPSAQVDQTNKSAATFYNPIEKPINSPTIIERALLQASDLSQFNRQLFIIASQHGVQNESGQPIPYLIEEEGRHSIIYLHGKVNIRCWLEISNEKSIGKQCQQED